MLHSSLSHLAIKLRKQFQDPKNVDLLEVDRRVSADERNRQNLNFPAFMLLQSHTEPHRIVDAGIRVDDKLGNFAGHCYCLPITIKIEINFI